MSVGEPPLHPSGTPGIPPAESAAEAEADSPSAPKAMAWAAATLVLTRGATLVSTLVLARLLLPSEFGLFAVGLLVVNYLDRVKDAGVGAALIYRREKWADLAPTALSISVLTAVALAATTFVAAPLVGAFFDDQAISIVRALALVLLISGLMIVPESRLHRELDFRRRVLPETIAAVVKAAVSILLGVAGYGVWSLVWGQLVGTTFLAVMYWLLCGWRPHLAWHRKYSRVLLAYGLPSALVAVLSSITDNIDYVVIGGQLSTADLGYYVLAYRLPELSVIAICIVAGQVFFPWFSRFQDDVPALRATYLRAVRYVSLVTFPVGVGLAVVAPEVVRVMYSDRWDPSIPLLRILALFTVVYSMSFHAGEIYKSTGRPGVLNTLAILKVLVLVPIIVWAAHDGIVAVAWGVLVANVILTAVKLTVAMRILRLPAVPLLGAFGPAAACSAVMGAATLGARLLAPGERGVLSLVVAVAVAVPVYVLTVRVLVPEVFQEAWKLIRRPSLGTVPSESS